VGEAVEVMEEGDGGWVGEDLVHVGFPLFQLAFPSVSLSCLHPHLSDRLTCPD